MKKEYLEPEIDVVKLSFESILEEHLIEHSSGEDGGVIGGEGLD